MANRINNPIPNYESSWGFFLLKDVVILKQNTIFAFKNSIPETFLFHTYFYSVAGTITGQCFYLLEFQGASRRDCKNFVCSKRNERKQM